jgi:hypothetical protein
VGELFARRVATDPEASAALARYLESDTEARETQALPPLPATDSLARLVLELVLTAAYAKEIVAEVMTVRAGWLVVRRGDATLEPATFDIAESYGPLGRALLA